MKIVVVGGTGLVGSRLVAALRAWGYDVKAASPSTGVDTLTGEGLSAALSGANVVVDATNAPSTRVDSALAFFSVSGRNLLAAAKAAGVAHHVTLSMVGADRLPQSGYFRAKMAQENLIRASGLPYTILRSTPLFECIDGIIATASDGDVVRLSPAGVQPVAADDVVAALCDVTLGRPQNGVVEIGGPDRFGLNELAEEILVANEDSRTVVADADALYFGAVLQDDTLTPGDGHPRFAPTRFENWLRLYVAQALAPAN